MLEVGSHRALHIREVQITCEATPRHVLYISDLHLSAYADHVIDQVEQATHMCQPDLILFGGDLVDNQSGLAALTTLTHTLTAQCPVWAVPGNHDQTVGYKRVHDSLVWGGGVWLGDTACTFGELLYISCISADRRTYCPTQIAIQSCVHTTQPCSLMRSGRATI